jgi:pimeloyl-ACP methyl ester carboxylesterase
MTFLHLIQRLFLALSIAVLVTGAYMVWSWWRLENDGLVANDPDDSRLFVGAALLAISLLGRPLVLLLFGRHSGEGSERRRHGEGSTIDGAGGARIHIESHGPDHAPALVFTHAWGMDSTLWWEAKQRLSDRFRVVVWDLPGLGRSRGPADGRISLDRYASDLRAVVSTIPGRCILVGHSIGGMTIQVFCQRYPELLGRQVAGIVLENTTHTNAIKTTFLGGFLGAIRWPVIEPALRLDIWLQPLVWAMTWQSYLSGAQHLAMRIAGFGSKPTRAQLDHAALLPAKASPAVQAKGNLAMMRWDATDDLPGVRIPALVLIGGRDLVTRPEAGERIGDLLPLARAVRVRKAGHMGPIELADEYNAAVAEFADEVFTSGAVWADRPPQQAPAPSEAPSPAPNQSEAPRLRP